MEHQRVCELVGHDVIGNLLQESRVVCKHTRSNQLQPIVVDDYIPVEAESGEPVFCKSKNKEIWAIILEKAWAKLNGNFARSASVYSNYASIALTGTPSEYY